MPELTPKIGLKKPLGNEAVNRASYNEVLDQIDAAMPVVPTWALQDDKPAYTANDVGALPATAQAADSAKLGGKEATYYAPANILLTLTLQGGSANWTNNRQTVTAPGVVVGDGQVGTPIPEDMETWSDAEIKLLPATEAGKVTFSCGTAPTTDMIVRLMLTEVNVQ